MRILIISNNYPPHSTGGYDIAAHAFAHALMRRAHELAVVTSRVGVPARNQESGVDRTLHRPQDGSSLVKLLVWERLDHRALRRAIRVFEPDVLYAWNLLQLFPSVHGVLAGARVPVVYNIQDLWIPRHLEAGRALRDAWEARGSGLRAGVRRVAAGLLGPLRVGSVGLSAVSLDHVVFCSQFQLAQHRSYGLPLRSHVVVHNGVALDQFSVPRERCFSGVDPLRALFIGRMVPEKGAHIAVEAVAASAARGLRVVLTIAGIPSFPHSYEQGVRARVSALRLEDRITFVGAVPNRELGKLHATHDVLVFPSSHIEGLPMTVIEAMASGLPVVGTLTGGTREILEPGANGLAMSTENALEAAAHLEALSATPAKLASLARRARETAHQGFNIDTRAADTEAYLERVAADSGP